MMFQSIVCQSLIDSNLFDLVDSWSRGTRQNDAASSNSLKRDTRWQWLFPMKHFLLWAPVWRGAVLCAAVWAVTGNMVTVSHCNKASVMVDDRPQTSSSRVSNSAHVTWSMRVSTKEMGGHQVKNSPALTGKQCNNIQGISAKQEGSIDG